MVNLYKFLMSAEDDDEDEGLTGTSCSRRRRAASGREGAR